MENKIEGIGEYGAYHDPDDWVVDPSYSDETDMLCERAVNQIILSSEDK